MTQPAQALAPASPAPSGPSTTAADVAVQPGSDAAGQSETPRRLRLLTVGVLLAGVVFALVGAATFALQANALNRAEADTAQLVRVQQIQTNLLSADATATNAFLVGGLEPPAQRASYDRAIADSGALIAEAAEAQPADARALSALNTEMLAYAATIEQARANNRQGFPVGAQYLRNASAQLRATALPILDNLVQANTSRAAQEMGSRAAFWFEGIGALVLVGFVLGMVWLARTFKRTLNVGMLAAGMALLVSLVAGAIGLHSVDATLSDLKANTFARLTAAAQARIGANDAKSNESLTLIARGSGGAFETAWKASATKVVDKLGATGDDQLSQLWDGYAKVHTSIRTLDDGGRWDDAVRQATGGAANSSNVTFAAFDTAASRYVDGLATQTSVALPPPRTGLVIEAILALLAGIAAAVLGRWGIAARLREYR